MGYRLFIHLSLESNTDALMPKDRAAAVHNELMIQGSAFTMVCTDEARQGLGSHKEHELMHLYQPLVVLQVEKQHLLPLQSTS